MGQYIVQSEQFAHNPRDDDGQTPHQLHFRGEEIELDDDHHHTRTLVSQGVVVSKQAHENRENAQAEASRLDRDVSSSGSDSGANALAGTGQKNGGSKG